MVNIVKIQRDTLENNGVTIREAREEDIPVLVDLGEEFYNKSNFEEGGYDSPQLAYTLTLGIHDENSVLLVAEIGDKVVGFVACDVARYYTIFPVSHMFLFFVKEGYAKYNVGSKLVEAKDAVVKSRGCRYAYSSSSAGFEDEGHNDRGLELIYKRLGYEPNGFYMRRTL